MTLAMITNETLTEIADAIRERAGTEDDYLPSEMPDAIRGITGGSAFPPKAVTGISAKVGHAKVGLLFDDPSDLVYDDYPIYEWAGTRVVRKAGSAPSSQSDGTVVANSTVRDAHVSEHLVDTGLVDGTTYYYGLFPYSTAGAFQTDASQVVSATPSALGVAPPTNLAVKVGHGKAQVSWTDPTDVEDTASRYGTAWARTHLVRKEGAVPESVSDGVVVVRSEERGAYASEGYVDATAEDGTTYYYGLFAESADGAVGAVVAAAATPSALAVGSVSNLAAMGGNGTATVTWEDPADVADTPARFGARWAKTVLVRKAGSAPAGPADGTVVATETVRDSHATAGFEDSGLDNGTEYFYAAFAYSSDGAVSAAATASCTPSEFDPASVTWADSSWDEIAVMLAKHYAGEFDIHDYWHVGDTRTVPLAAMSDSLIYTTDGSSHAAQSVELVLMSADHYDKSDGSGKAAFVFGQKHSLAARGKMNSSDTNSGGWNGCGRRTWCNETYKAALPEGLQSLLKQVNVVTASGSSTAKATSKDYIFLAAEKEVFGSTSLANSTAESSLSQWTWYATSANRVKKRGSSANYWWERSPCSGGSSGFCRVGSDGTANGIVASNSGGLAPAGCI